MSDILTGLLQAVDEQLQSPKTVYVKKTYDRLIATGMNDAQVREEIADCLGEELDEMLEKNRPFSEKNYRVLLDQLPWDEKPETLNDLQKL